MYMKSVFESLCINLTWVWALRLVMAPSVQFYEIAKKHAMDVYLLFYYSMKTPFSAKIRNKKWGSPYSFSRKWPSPDGLSLALMKIRHFINVRELMCAAITQEIMHSRVSQCKTGESP